MRRALAETGREYAEEDFARFFRRVYQQYRHISQSSIDHYQHAIETARNSTNAMHWHADTTRTQLPCYWTIWGTTG